MFYFVSSFGACISTCPYSSIDWLHHQLNVSSFPWVARVSERGRQAEDVVNAQMAVKPYCCCVLISFRGHKVLMERHHQRMAGTMDWWHRRFAMKRKFEYECLNTFIFHSHSNFIHRPNGFIAGKQTFGHPFFHSSLSNNL